MFYKPQYIVYVDRYRRQNKDFRKVKKSNIALNARKCP
nr:MAG TPA: MAS20 protein import receptor [Caudoviricetes sp.]